MAAILVIEDEELMRDMLLLLLERKGHFVVGAAHGQEAEALCQHYSFDVVITDILMPVQEGMETIVMLKHYFPDIKIIAMTGGGKTSPQIYLEIAKKLGADHTLQKPFKHQDILNALDLTLAEAQDQEV